MVKGFGEASVSKKKSSKSSSLTSALDCEQLQKQLAEHFGELKDPRGSQSVLHCVSAWASEHSTRGHSSKLRIKLIIRAIKNRKRYLK